MRWLLPLLLLAGCVPTYREMKVGVKDIQIRQIVLEDWCYLDGQACNGWTIAENQRKYSICVSLKSDMPERTLEHELRHVARYSLGLDLKWKDHP